MSTSLPECLNSVLATMSYVSCSASQRAPKYKCASHLSYATLLACHSFMLQAPYKLNKAHVHFFFDADPEPTPIDCGQQQL